MIPAPLARGGAEPEPESAWWCFDALQQAVLRDAERNTPLVRDGWRALEERINVGRPERIVIRIETKLVDCGSAGAPTERGRKE